MFAGIASMQPVSVQGETREYTWEEPLIYEDAWDLWPYVYLNEEGIAEGFNIDLLKLIFEKLDIPYVIRLKPSNEALEDLKTGRSDLMLGMAASFHNEYARYGQRVVQLFTHSAVSAKSQPVKISQVEDLAHRQIVVHTGSFSHHLMIDRGWGNNCVPFNDMREAIKKLSEDNQGVIVWNTLSLKWLLNKYQIDNLQLTPIDMPHGEYRFMSNDSLLLSRLDSVFAQLQQSEQLRPIFTKWFFPEQVDSGIPEWIKYVVVIAAIFAFLLLYYVIVLEIQERRVTRLIAKHNCRLALVLRTTKVRVLLYDVKRQRLAWMNSNGEMGTREYTLDEYGHIYKEAAINRLKESIQDLKDGKQKRCEVELVTEDTHGQHNFMLTLSVFRRNKRGVAAVIVGIVDDQTERLLQQRKAKDNMLRYRSIFSTSLVDMTYYNTKGVLTDINQKACETFGFVREEVLSKHLPVTQALGDMSASVEQFEGCYSTRILKDHELMGFTGVSKGKDVYYEQQLIPVHDSDNRFIGIFGSGRDVTEFVNSYRQLRRSVAQTTLAAQQVTDYINNINYALHVGGIRLVNYTPRTHILTIFKEMNVVQLKLTQSRCLALVDDRSRRIAMRMMNNMDQYSDESVDITIGTHIRTHEFESLHLQFSLRPIINDAGEVDSYFGLCRDVSKEKETADELEREKAKAQEVENVKNAFLRNMSYEIRTPIATVVGFAELFGTEHDVEDEPGFIAEMKSNASYLLKLVNDILLLSRLDANMIEYKLTPTDFAKTFEGHCQMGWLQDRKPGVEYVIESQYEHLVLDIDDFNLGRVVKHLAQNAARFTERGRVVARYEYIGDRLFVTIEDSGCGVSKEQQKKMFDRFNSHNGGHNTGLGLPICKELLRQMGGDIYINSDLGCGTTMWLILPCKASIVEKKLLTN